MMLRSGTALTFIWISMSAWAAGPEAALSRTPQAIVTERLACALSYTIPSNATRIPGGASEASLSDQKLELSEETRDVEYKVSLESPKDSKPAADAKRPFRIVLRNKRTNDIGHLDGTLAMLRTQGGATLRLQTREGVNTLPRASEIRIHCSVQ